uniref:Formamidopyrimidine-DNA glycosylase n=1 Tax=Candidatus Kentrum sp. MB TaxID=2138164 RepID=A0A450X541_9GAMM|nr:MAG: DNA-(apurinic or apyrimidinic site) lyase [Candidatus Kentron sp. MB]VFK30673.1 MAG: DNA-(apurinic or apyrimidinic site) lyase [Candidatus Kentron sp. MB]VFK75352.1 MAG: DNA-(apurinic or apyrimidinic site) lyase [Candidatus Kentron sp. MB]
MPELPEVETICRGLARYLPGDRIKEVVVRNRRLRWPIPECIGQELPGQSVQKISRRGKYLLFHLTCGTMIVHLGMSGSLRLFSGVESPGKHDHVDLVFEGGDFLRFRDPRRFGAILWTESDPLQHPRLARLGPEPLEGGFSGRWLWKISRNRRISVKCLLMDGGVVAGLGNIYANEALFRAGILPSRSAGRISLRRYDGLAASIRDTLREAIDSGGTTLRDFFGSSGTPGYFQQRLQVYGRAGLPCPRCGHGIKRRRENQRSSFFCPHCQK